MSPVQGRFDIQPVCAHGKIAIYPVPGPADVGATADAMEPCPQQIRSPGYKDGASAAALKSITMHQIHPDMAGQPILDIKDVL